jgi:hypothetical protein
MFHFVLLEKLEKKSYVDHQCRVQSGKGNNAVSEPAVPFDRNLDHPPAGQDAKGE